MDQVKKLETYSTRELIDELKLRIAELDEARALLAGTLPSPAAGKNPKLSAAKVEYWKSWWEYKAAHPIASVEDWRSYRSSTRNAT